MAKYIYYVSFLHESGHGSYEVSLDHEIASYDDIEEIAKKIAGGFLKHVTIMSFHLLKLEEENDG